MARSTANPGPATSGAPSNVVVGNEIEIKNDAGSAVPVSSTTLATESSLAFTKSKFQPAVRTTEAGVATSSGDTAIHTPASGKKCRLYWIGLSSSQDNANENLVIVKFGASGPAVYRWRMGSPGAFAHWEILDGAVDQPLILNLANGEDIDWNITYEDVAP